MAKQVIRLTESELNNIIKEATLKALQESQLLLEMPYQRNEFILFIDGNARNAYIHLAKILLYKDLTNDVNKWINDIVNNFTIPTLIAKVYVNNKARAKCIYNGYIENLFGKGFIDYEEQMGNFCFQCIKNMEGNAQKANSFIPSHDDVEQSIVQGKNLIVAYANAVVMLSDNHTPREEAHHTLQTTIRAEVNKAFGLKV